MIILYTIPLNHLIQLQKNIIKLNSLYNIYIIQYINIDHDITKTVKPNICSAAQNVKENRYRIVPIMWLG